MKGETPFDGPRWAMAYMGALFVAQGVGKALDPAGYVDALTQFPLVGPVGAGWLAPVWTSAELVVGAAMFVAALARRLPRSLARFGTFGAMGVALGYTTLVVHGLALGAEVANCTCFGVFLPQRLSAFVLLQEIVVWIVLASLVRRVQRAPSQEPSLVTP